MSKVINAIVNFVRDEEGTELVEWGLIAGLIIVVAAGLFFTMGGDLKNIFTVLQSKTAAGSAAATAAQ